MSDLKVGDPVQVIDQGLIMLQQFAPQGAFPNNWGIVDQIKPEAVYVLFPIGDDPMDQHSQVAPYDHHEVQKLMGKGAEKMLMRAGLEVSDE